VLSDLTLPRQEAYVTFRRSRGIADGTITRELTVLRSAVRRSQKRGVIVSAPFIIDPEDAEAKRNKDPKGRPLSIEEMARLFNAVKSQHGWMLLMILCNTLCRPGAAFDLTASQRDHEHDLLVLNPAGRKQTKKYRPVVPITNTLREQLDHHENEMRTLADAKGGRYEPKLDRYVSYAGRKIRGARTLMRDLRINAGFVLEGKTQMFRGKEKSVGDPEVNLYSIRHTMGRELRKRRVPSDEISIMLGHLPMDVKRIDLVYSPFDPDFCRNAVAAIDAYFEELACYLRVGRWWARQGSNL
jgi:integrase